MPDSTIKTVYTGTKLDGESLSEWTKEWKRLSPQEQQELRDEAAKMGATN